MSKLLDQQPNYTKITQRSLQEQIDVVAEFHAHRIHPLRIAYRTGVNIDLVASLIEGREHTHLFKRRLAAHRKRRREQRLHASSKLKGTAQIELQSKIEQDFKRDR